MANSRHNASIQNLGDAGPAVVRASGPAAMTDTTSRYPIPTSPAETARLRMQANAMAPDTGVLLDRIGVAAGWQCLDLACGCGGITDLLAARVGGQGRVLGLDRDAALLAAARDWAAGLGLASVAFAEADVRATGQPRASFDLVHMRFILSTAGHADATLDEALALVRPGGVLVAQEPDIAPLCCYPRHPAWDRLKGLLEELFCHEPTSLWADGLYQRFLDLGLEDVQYRPFVAGFTSAHPMVDYMPTTIGSLAEVFLEKGMISPQELERTVAACRAHLHDPRTVSTSYMVAQVWGRKP